MASASPATIAGISKTLDDRISELPESLLVQILSLLPTKDAFRTSILSKRWKYLWTSLYNFDFSYDSPTCKGLNKFEFFVDYVLAHSVSSKIEKFKLRNPCHSNDNISRWLNFAVERNVEHVVLILEDPLLIPGIFGTCSSLITLDMTCCEFEYSNIPLSWKSLKSIKLKETWLSEEYIVILLEGCPGLENMEIKRVECFDRLEINSLNLKRLYLKDFRVDEDENDKSMEIFAPYLQHFEIWGDLEYVKIRILDMSSLISANLNFTNSCLKWYGEDCQNDHQGFITLVLDNLQKLSCATELTLGYWFTEVLCMLQLKEVPIPKLKCKYVTLELDIAFNLYGAAGILRALPYVETLYIDVFPGFGRRRCDFELRCLAEGDSIDLQSWISSFEFPNLKNVNIVNSSGVCVKNHYNRVLEKLFKLSEFVLKNATILEKFVISKSIVICSMNRMSPSLSYLTKTLGCPRASTNCEIIFQE